MMGIIAKIFGNNSVVEKTADGIYNGIDSAILTPEERIKYHLDYLKAYEPFKLAQRLLSLVFSIPYVLIWIVCAGLYAASLIGDPCTAEAVCKSAQMMAASKELASMNNATLGTPVAIIVGFYFAGGAVEGVVGKIRNKQ